MRFHEFLVRQAEWEAQRNVLLATLRALRDDLKALARQHEELVERVEKLLEEA